MKSDGFCMMLDVQNAGGMTIGFEFDPITTL